MAQYAAEGVAKPPCPGRSYSSVGICMCCLPLCLRLRPPLWGICQRPMGFKKLQVGQHGCTMDWW